MGAKGEREERMKYLKFILYAIVDIAFNIIAYLTNPFVLLFADEVGNLPHIFCWWENWDDHLDIELDDRRTSCA